jgi:RNA polymerase sigma-70 factor, ECF subfamily
MHNDQPDLARQVAETARKLGRGDLGALGRLYDLTAPRLVRYANTLTRNQDDAEDALQAAMARVAENARRLAAAQHPWAYFLKIVRNEALKIVGRRKPTQCLSDLMQIWTADEMSAEREESRVMVRAALKRLPPEQAEVVVLKIWEEMTFLEIAIVLGESANTAASRYRYALAKMSRELQPLAGEVRHD